MKHKLVISATLAFASVTYSSASFGNEVEANAKNQPNNITIDSIPPVSVTCNRCDELTRKYRSSTVNEEFFRQADGMPLRISQEIEEAE